MPGLAFPALNADNLFKMFDSLFGGAAGVFKNFLTNLGTLFSGMGLLNGVFDLNAQRAAIEYFLTNTLGIATRGLDGVLQFGGTLVSNALGALGDFFENLADFFGFDMRAFARGELSIFDMAILFLDKIKKALESWVTSFVLGGSANLVEWAQANVLVPVIGNFLTGLKIDWRTLGYSTVEDLLNAGWSSLSQIAGKLLTSLTQIPANLISGVLPPGILGTVPVSSIADVSQNLLAQGAFADGISVEASDNWIWDGTQNATGTGGSVKVTVSPAKNRYLYARQAVPVAAGDRLIVNATIKTSGLLLNNAGNTPISISIIPYAGSTQATVNPIQIGSASGSATSWTTIGNSKTNPYTVTDSTWTSIIVQLKVDTGTYSGTVWWDDITVAKTGALLQGNVDSLIAAWNSTISGLYGQGTPGSTYDWTSLFSAAAQARGRAETGITNNATTVSVLGTSPQSYINNLSGVNADGSRSIGTMLQFLISTLGDTGALTNLGTDVLALYYAAAQARARANLGVTTAEGTNTTLGTSPGTLIKNLFDVSADGSRSIGIMIGYLIATLKNSTSSYNTDVANLYFAALEARNQANLGVTRSEGTNSVLFGTTTTGTQVKTTALNTTGANGIGAAIVPGSGAGATMWRTSTTPVGAFGGRHKFSEHGGFFNSASASTTEVTVSSSTATFTVARAGWYIAEISFAVGVGGTTGFNASALLYKDGSAYRVGPDAIQTATRTNRYSHSSFIVYLNAGGTLTAGYDVDATTGTPQFSADAAGTMTTFSVALMNPTF